MSTVQRTACLNHELMKHEKYFFTSSLLAIFLLISVATLFAMNQQQSPLFKPADTALTTASPAVNNSLFLISEGTASYYSTQFHGRKTANGETFNMHQLTAAHPSLPFGTCVKVTNMSNGKDVIVRINDRGPFVKGRIIDLSAGAAKKLGIIKSGTVPVKLEALESAPRASVAG